MKKYFWISGVIYVNLFHRMNSVSTTDVCFPRWAERRGA
jgi:hypothetical protein